MALLPHPAYAFEIFLALWALIPIVFFSLSRSKLPGYILPSIPALLILAAVAVHRRAARNERPHWTSIVAHAVLLAALAAGALHWASSRAQATCLGSKPYGRRRCRNRHLP